MDIPTHMPQGRPTWVALFNAHSEPRQPFFTGEDNSAQFLDGGVEHRMMRILPLGAHFS